MKSKGHVFVVDDDQDIRIHLGDVLNRHGYGVSDFSSAALFLQMRGGTLFSILLSCVRNTRNYENKSSDALTSQKKREEGGRGSLDGGMHERINNRNTIKHMN